MKFRTLLIALQCVGCTISLVAQPVKSQETQGENHVAVRVPRHGIAKALPSVPGAKKMNVIFILTDDHRYDFMGFTGRLPWQKTPNMDRMASEGAHMKNAFVTTSLCSPSRASILTGQYSHVHTIVDNLAGEPDGLIYFPQYLQKAGYQTSFFGKWHMGDDDDRPRPGFNHWESFRGQGVYYSPKLNINGSAVQYSDSTYITDLLTEHAIKWLDKRDKDKPFFMYLSHKAVHAPFVPAPRHKGLYKGQFYPLPSTYWQTADTTYRKYNWPEWVKQQRNSWHGVDFMYHSRSNMDSMIQVYAETLMAVDESIGSVIEYLEKNKLAENTVIIYMGDNGFSWGEHGLIDKRHFYEESVKVPFLVYAPGLIKNAKTVTQMVQNIDIAPTVFELAGLQKPSYMPGRSFLQLLRGDTTSWRNKIFYEYYWEYDFPMTPTVFGVRTTKYKFIRYMGIWDQNELYDLENDPQEIHNLMGKPEYAALARSMAKDLYDWLEQTKGMQIPIKRTIKKPFGDWKHPHQY